MNFLLGDSRGRFLAQRRAKLLENRRLKTASPNNETGSAILSAAAIAATAILS
jgi:hypothetical protein